MVSDISAFGMAELAKVMALKYGFLGIPPRGSHAGILCDENMGREHKLRLLAALGVKIQNLLSDWNYSPQTCYGCQCRNSQSK